jgi:hypothetical protein
MQPLWALTAVLLALLSLPACRNADPTARWLGDIEIIAAPGGAGGRYPHLVRLHDEAVLMSWLQPVEGGGFALHHSIWRDGAWGPTGTVTSGANWFVNWADFPSVVPVDGNTWAAHWLEQRHASTYAYDVRVAMSRDSGASWTAPMSPHQDGTPTEHGFVSLFGEDGSAQAVWLDGRHTAGGHDHDAGHGDAAAGAMTLRTAAIGVDGRRAGTDLEIDSRVCDCCQTDVALSAEGPVAVYRDRSAGELRDIALVRRQNGRWSAPIRVHADGWRIDACPVNGPVVDARGRRVVVAWFTAPDQPRVRLAFSDDAGRNFAPPLEVASGDVIGRVDVVLLEDGRAVVSWMQRSQDGAEIIARPYTNAGAAGDPVVVAATAVQRSSGFPQMVRAGDGLLFAWTGSGDPPRLRTVYAPLH